MTIDAFTNTDGTPLGSHTAAGVTWAPMVALEVQGIINSNAVDAGAGGFNVRARASSSTSDYHEIVFKAGTYGGDSKAVHVRASAGDYGYFAQAGGLSGDDVTAIVLWKGETFLDFAGVTFSRLVDNVVAIRATTVGGNVEIRAWLNGDPVVWGGAGAEVYVDSSTPVLNGNPGFSYLFGTGFTQASSAFDTSSDAPPSEGTAGDATGDLGTATSAAPSGQASAARSLSVTLRGGNGLLLNTVSRRFWTRTTLDAAAADGGAGGLAVTCNSLGVFNLTGLNVATGAGWLTYKDPADSMNCHTVPVTFV